MRSLRSLISSFFSSDEMVPSFTRRAWYDSTRCVSAQKSRSLISRSLTGMMANASLSSRSAAVPTLSMVGFGLMSPSAMPSMNVAIACTHVLVCRCRSRINASRVTRSSGRVGCVESSSKTVA